MAYQVRRRIWNGSTLQSQTFLGQPGTQCEAEERLLREVGTDISTDTHGLGWKYVCGSLETTGLAGCRTQDPDSNKAREYDVVSV